MHANTNGKISLKLKVYINQNLKLVVNPWLLEKHDFVWKENGDNAYGKAKNRNIVKKRKEKNNLKYFLNFAFSPGLSLIENC